MSRYEAVLTALDAGVVIHSADTAIVEANQRARALLGLQDLEGRLATDPSWVFLEADHSPMPLERFPVMQVISSKQPLRGLIMVVRPSMNPDVVCEVNAVPILDDSGQLEQVAVTFIDITARKRAEQELAHSSGYARSLIEAGAVDILLGDTTGMANPRQARHYFEVLLSEFGDAAEFTAHFHNTRGAGLANVLGALEAGCTSFDSSFGELGGCPFPPGATGNIATEDLVSMLDGMGVETGIDIDVVLDAARSVRETLGRPLTSHTLVAGPVDWNPHR